MWFRRIERRLTAFGKIGIGALAIHVIALIALMINHLVSPSKAARQPLAVRMHQQIASPPKQELSPKQPAKKTAALKKTIKPAPPREIKKRQAAPCATPTPEQKSSPEIHLPSFIESSPMETKIEMASESSSYAPSLALFLQSELQLPEIGEVKTRIVLVAPGRIASVEILDAKSGKNAEWLKIQLPLLMPPCFNDFSISDARLEFTITFRNVEKT